MLVILHLLGDETALLIGKGAGGLGLFYVF
jgi:hypothetical protein